MKDKINIGLIGYGTVGSGVYKLLSKNAETIQTRTGLKLRVKTICDLNVERVKAEVSDCEITDSWESVTSDGEIDIVVELIGGNSPAMEIIVSALRNGKNVVTANKKLLAERNEDIMSALLETGQSIGYEAAIGGGIPCVLALKKGLVGNRIKSILGILNGTTNYILTKMEEQGITFEEALRDSQEKGFAEADPTFDVEGIDAGHKIALLAILAYGEALDFAHIPIEGITHISPEDMGYAKDMGYVIKLLGIARKVNGSLDVRVHPTMIPLDHPLASVRHEFNSVMFDGDMTDAIVLNGKGAGSFPTASAVVSDIVQLANRSIRAGEISGHATMMLPEDRNSRYYLRIHTEDNMGMLSKISGILGEHDISIASVIQKETTQKIVPLIIFTHFAIEKNILTCIKKIENFDCVHDNVVCIRVEDFEGVEEMGDKI